MAATGSQQRDWSVLTQQFEGYRSGDLAATSALFFELSRILKGYFFARTRNELDTQDLTQATLLKIHLAQASFDHRQSLKTWVFVVAHRTLIDHWRKGARHEWEGQRESAEDLEDVASHHSGRGGLGAEVTVAIGLILQRHMDALKPIDRTVVYLSVEEGLSMAEIAQAIGSTEGAVKVRIHRVLKALRHEMSPASSQPERGGLD